MVAETINQYALQTIKDLNANNFTGAWGTAEASTALYGGGNANDAPTKDPLVAALESSQGLKQLDPTKAWTPQETQAYYAALGRSGGYTGAGTLGKNPYGLWGDQGAVIGGSDAAANIAQEGVTPDVQRFAGARPSGSFLSKWGPDILALAAAVAAPEAIGALGGSIAGATGAGALGADVAAGGLYGAGTGALLGEVSGGNVGKDALLGALGGAVTGGIEGSGLTGFGRTGAEVGGKELTSLARNTLTSPSGKGTSMAAQPMSTALPTTDLGTPGSSPSAGLDWASLAPYLGVGALGMFQANRGQSQDARYANSLGNLAAPNLAQAGKLTGAYNTNTLNPTDAAALNTGTALGESMIAGAAPLSAIANQAFQEFNSGTLKPGDQAQLDALTTSNKQQLAQQFATAGISDSTMLASANAEIDNKALMTKQQMLNSYFQTGVTAYDNWLTSTQAGTQVIQDAQRFASTQLQNYLQMAMAESSIGLTTATQAIQTQMQTDQQYAQQVSQLMQNLATGYARQAAARALGSKNTGDPNYGLSPVQTTAQQLPMPGDGSLPTDVSGGITDTSLGSIPSDIVDPSLLSSSGGDLASSVGDLGSILGG